MSSLLYIMSAHEMWSLGQAVTGSVDGASYDPDNLCDGDPANPVLTPSTSASFDIALANGDINGLVVANTNLSAGATIAFSGLGSVTAPAVPKNGIRLNGWALLDPAVTSNPGSTTLSISGEPGQIALGLAIVGYFRSIRNLPTEPTSTQRAFQNEYAGEYDGLSYGKGGKARTYGGTVYLTDAEKTILENAYDASYENSRPTVIVTQQSVNDAMVVKWTTFEPKPGERPDLWVVDVEWQELPRYRWSLAS
jgi:hypothetical protein